MNYSRFQITFHCNVPNLVVKFGSSLRTGLSEPLLRTICHKFLRSGGETSLNCLKFPQIRPSLPEYSAGLKTCENSRKRTRLLPKKTHSENESEKSSPKKAKIESITKVIFRVVVRPSI